MKKAKMSFVVIKQNSMYFNVLEETKHCSGIYLIHADGGKSVYVGSTNDLYRRFKEHDTQLKNGSHHCDGLLNAYRKHGDEKFIFEILELCDDQNLIEREQYWMDRSGRLYNSSKVAGRPLGVKRSEEVKQLLSKSALQRSRDNPYKSLRTNTSGYPGIDFNKPSGLWRARVIVDYKMVFCRYFDSAEEAHNARVAFVEFGIVEDRLRYNNTSGYRGVNWHKLTESWQASCTLQGKKKHLGLFKTPEEAAIARQRFIEEHLCQPQT